jgi:serine/threonine protein kinase
MGAVFEVERQSDAKRLALKVITGVVSGAVAARFAREAEIGARMNDPHLVAIVDVGIARSRTPFLVMEHIVGGSLEDSRHRFGDVEWGLPILSQVVGALHALHSAGIVHRDLKPGNVLLAENGDRAVAKVSDFGISRFDEPAGVTDALGATIADSSPVSPANKLTGTGAILGTPQYMAPESARGPSAVGPSSDMFSFGVLAYEVLTGRVPFSMPPVFYALAGQPTPAPAPLGEGSAALEQAIASLLLQCLSSDPSVRPSPMCVSEALRARAVRLS